MSYYGNQEKKAELDLLRREMAATQDALLQAKDVVQVKAVVADALDTLIKAFEVFASHTHEFRRQVDGGCRCCANTVTEEVDPPGGY